MLLANMKAVSLVGLTIVLSVSAQSTPALPIVDLGYQRQQANAYNTSAGYYNFSNIRFAASTTGKNRWRVPQPPSNNKTLQTGDVARICPQASVVKWQNYYTSQFIPEYLRTGRTNWTEADFNVTNSPPPYDPRGNEDCLFLDVIVPDGIFNGNTSSAVTAPVLVWFFGGGYVGSLICLVIETSQD